MTWQIQFDCWLFEKKVVIADPQMHRDDLPPSTIHIIDLVKNAGCAFPTVGFLCKSCTDQCEADGVHVRNSLQEDE